jgi:hypothetical protein
MSSEFNEEMLLSATRLSSAKTKEDSGWPEGLVMPPASAIDFFSGDTSQSSTFSRWTSSAALADLFNRRFTRATPDFFGDGNGATSWWIATQEIYNGGTLTASQTRAYGPHRTG